jgi:hypothetical protein
MGVDTSHAQIDEQMHRYYTAWVNTKFADDQSDAWHNSYRQTIDKLTFDCRSKKYKGEDQNRYDANGAYVPSIPVGILGWLDPVPESLAEVMVKGVCEVLTSPTWNGVRAAAGSTPAKAADGPSAASHPTSEWYIGGGSWWFDRDMSRRSGENDNTTMGLLGWHVEAGIAGPVGLRARYAEAQEVFTSGYSGIGMTPTRIRAVSTELLLELASWRFIRTYGGGGAQWTSDRDVSPPVWKAAAVGTLGIDTGVRKSMAAYAEVQWASGGIEYHWSPYVPPGQHSGETIIIGLRVY